MGHKQCIVLNTTQLYNQVILMLCD